MPRMARSSSTFAVVALALVAASCDRSIDPIQVAAECPAKPLRGPLEYQNVPRSQLISDFETNTDALVNVDGRNGAWVLGTDGSSGTLTAQPSGNCAADGKFAGHFAANGFASWGNNWTAVFIGTPGNASAAPFDASKYSGISFWAAFGGGNGESFDVPVGVTTMDNAWNGHICTKCMDYYRTKVPLTHDWQRFVVSFASMAQAGWGTPQVPMRKDQMVGFIIWPLQHFDIWIDDVRFEP